MGKVFGPILKLLLLPFCGSREFLRSAPLVALILLALFATTYLSVRANALLGAVTDALVQRDWPALKGALLGNLWVGLAVMGLSIAHVAARSLLELRWRTWLTADFLQRWAGTPAYFAIERDQLLGNIDQRITQDIAEFVSSSVSVFFSLVMALVQAATFGPLLWQLSGSLHLLPIGVDLSVPGYMVWLALVYAALNLVLVHVTGRSMMRFNMQQQVFEGEFRYATVQLRESAEQIAFYCGGIREQARIFDRFLRLRANSLALIVRSALVFTVDQFYNRIFEPIATVAILPRYIAGEISLGDITRVTGAFGMFVSTISVFSQSYLGIARWRALGMRLVEFRQALAAAADEPGGITWQQCAGGAGRGQIRTSALELRDPKGRALALVPPLTIRAGDRWMVQGPSGSGKSTLLRALAGLWPYGSGGIVQDEGITTMFLPQRSYVPVGSLRAAVAYPSDPGRFDAASVSGTLKTLGLGHLVHLLDTEDNWQQRLSGGEQQRLAVARAMLHRPDFLFLDEATSALDNASEQHVYACLIRELPQSALVSVAHHETLVAFHDRFLAIVPAQASAAS